MESLSASNESALDVDRWSRHLWHTSQHNNMPIFLAGRLQDQANEMRKAAGLPEFGWNDAFPDADFEECSVDADECKGQETHADVIAARVALLDAVFSIGPNEMFPLTWPEGGET